MADLPQCGAQDSTPSERDAGQRATAFTTAAVEAAEKIVVRDPAWGKWGGRVIANLVLDGRSLSAMLIEESHGRPYAVGRRGSWCNGG